MDVETKKSFQAFRKAAKELETQCGIIFLESQYKTKSGDMITLSNWVKITTTGHIKRMQFYEKPQSGGYITMLPGMQYIVNRTGEVKQFNERVKTKIETMKSVAQSMQRLRDRINCNVNDIDKTLWITFTYRENMQDPKQLSYDWKIFNKAYRRLGYDYKYITVAEPQGRGAWHMHAFFIFPESIDYLDYDKIREVWGHGAVTVQRIYGDINNLGAYLSAYLCNYEMKKTATIRGNVHILKQHDGTEKRFIKGQRLGFYPAGMQLYRCSNGLKKPEIEYTDIITAKKKVGSATPTLKRETAIENNGYTNTYVTEYYNDLISDCQVPTK